MILFGNDSFYLSPPGVSLTPSQMTNEEVIEKVKENFNGQKEELKKIERGLRRIFNACGTNLRTGKDPEKSQIEYILEASKNCIDQASVSINEIDLLIYGGIFREYFEPATATEIAYKLGITKVQAFDVTSACVGLMQSIITAVSLMAIDESINAALCCSSEILPDYQDYIDYNIQSFDELNIKGAGLTLGSSSAAWIITREVTGSGAALLKNFSTVSFPGNYEDCHIKVGGKFYSNNRQLYNYGQTHIAVELEKFIQSCGWNVDIIDHLICHQPGNWIIKELCKEIGLDQAKAELTHHFYGNTVNSSVPLTLNYLLSKEKINEHDKIVMSGFGAGFTMVNLAAEWKIK